MSAAAADVATKVEKPPAIPRGWSRQRVLGYALVGLWIVLGIGMIVYLVEAWNSELFQKYAPGYISGLGVTLTLVAVSIVLGAVLSVPVAYARMSRNRTLSSFAYAYVYFFRGTPLLTQVFLIYYGNEIILMIKGSAIVALITVYDLMGITKLTYSRTFDFQSYVWAAIIYLIIVETLRHAVEWIERRITIHLQR
jgi:His/Glu/Gln/Arg/opine family amino acid ABC transporter permease subunit